MEVNAVLETEVTDSGTPDDIPDMPAPLQETAESVEIVDTSPTIFSNRRTALHCAIKYCRNYQGNPRMNRYTTFYRFPRSPEFRAKWVALCRPGESLDTDNARVCDNHFVPGDFFFIADEKHLAEHAIPTANLDQKDGEKWRDRCAVLNCSSHKDLSRKVTHHKFPKFGIGNIRSEWIRLCQRNDKRTFGNALICSDHFTPDDYRGRPNAIRKRLKDDAVPSRFDCIPIASRPTSAIKKFRAPPEKREFIPESVPEPAVAPAPTPAPVKAKSRSPTQMQFEHTDVDPCSLFTNSSPYLPAEFPTFCHGCQKKLEGPCVLHEKRISDPPYSRASLPAELVLRIVDLTQETVSEVVVGVFAVNQIPKFTVFGPLVAPYGIAQEKPSSGFGVKTNAGWQEYCLDSDYTCNWLRNVRFAKAKDEQNLMAYQQNGHVYFSTLDVIEPGSELKVFYAPSYGHSRSATDLVAKLSEIPVGTSEFLGSTLPSSEDLELPDSELYRHQPTEMNMNLDTGANAEKIGEILSVFTEHLKDIRKNVNEMVLEVNAAPVSHEELHSSPLDRPEDLLSSNEDSPFESLAGVRRHVEQHKGGCPPDPPRWVNKTFPCPYCVNPCRRYSTQAMLDGHMKVVHNWSGIQKMMQGLPSAGAHECPVCLRNFDTSAEVLQHGVSHATDGAFKCRICSKNHDKFHALRTHMAEKHGPGAECKICGHKTSRSRDLEKHMAIHTNEYKYACDQCDRRFRFPSQLWPHKASWHDPANPPKFKAKPWKGPKVSDYLSCVFKCHDCKLGFFERKLFVRHLDARHPRVSKLSIPELNYPFGPIYKYPCPQRACRKNFDDEDQCREHLETDHGITDLSTVTIPEKRLHSRLYSCEKCDYRNTVLSQYHRHVQTAHSESSNSGNL